jgi:RHS repeat-associated protein
MTCLGAGHALTPARSYAWNFSGGNLIDNWSFENRMQNWDSAAKDSPAFLVDPRFPGFSICTGCNAVTGTFVARAAGYATAAAAQSRLWSEPFPIMPGAAYVLSFYVRSASVAGGTWPVVRFFSDKGTIKIDSAVGKAYGSLPKWTFYRYAFTAPQSAQSAQVVLAQSAGSGDGGTFYFDDAVLEEGSAPSSRARIGESISFLNAWQGLQKHQRVSTRLPGTGGPSCLDSLTLHSLQGTDVRDQTTLANTLVRGIVGSNTSVTIGANTTLFGNVNSGGGAWLRSSSLVDGNVRTAGTVSAQAGSQVTGTVTQYASVPACAIPSQAVPYGTQDIDVAGGGSLLLQPGPYRDIHVGANATVTLISGVYNVRSFFLEPDVRIQIHLSGSAMELNAQDNIRLGDRLKMSFLQEEDAFATRFYSNQATQLYIGTDARLFGTFTAPAGNITLSPRDTLTGALYASTLTVEAGCRIAPPASLGAAQTKYRVAGPAYDPFGRPFQSILPFALREDTVRYLEDLVSRANAYYAGDSGRADAHGRAFFETRYAEEPTPRAVETSPPDTAWRMFGKHTNRNDYGFVSDLAIPADIEGFSPLVQEAPYQFNWSRNADSGYTLVWSNRLGQVIQTAKNLNRKGPDASAWAWSVATFEYHPQGGLKRKTVNLEDGFPEITEYNSQGLAISTYSRSKGFTRYFYNRHGKLRFTQDSAQFPDTYTYTEYDGKDRILSQGVQTVPSLTQDQIDQNVLDAGAKSERRGYIYDDLSAFQARTGLALTSVLPASIVLHEGFGRLVCSYNRNSESDLPGFAAADKFVADFYDYDARGNVARQFQYLGPIRNPIRRLQQISYAYDASDRVITSTLYYSANDRAVGEHRYTYDLMGRVSAVAGLGGKPLADYDFEDYGPMRSVTLGGNGTGFSGAQEAFGYHSRGWLRSIQARQMGTGNTLWQQRLGFETASLADGSVPSPLQPKFDGNISQQLYQYANDLNGQNPVRLVNYAFDPMDRMVRAQAYKNANANPLDARGQIDFSALSLAPAPDLSTSLDYDETGRITGQRSRGASAADSARYHYLPGSFALDHVDGKVTTAVPRDLSAPGTFAYDGRGAMVQDKSKKLAIAYGWDKLPLKFEIATGTNTGALEYDFYNAQGMRVSSFAVARTGTSYVAQSGKHYVTLGGKTAKERVETYGSNWSLANVAETIDLYGQQPIGRITPAGQYQFFLKNHQGSVVKTVDDMGQEPSGGGNSYDYLAYGDLVKLKESGTTVTQKFTGKELVESYRLYYFGARFYDPELSRWTSPDPAGQYFDPYAYGNDPLNLVDPDGLWSIGLGLVIGWDKHGFHAGVGAAFDVDTGPLDVNLNASLTLSTDGSKTASLGAGGSIQLGIVGLNAVAGANYNTMDGYALNVHAGANIVAVGVELGTNQAWDTHGDYIGGNIYGEGYLGVKGLLSAGIGYEFGWGKGSHTGVYESLTLMLNTWSNHGDGWGYDGFDQTFGVISVSTPSDNEATLVTSQPGQGAHSAITGSYAGQDFVLSAGPGSWKTGSGLLDNVLSVFGNSESPLAGDSKTDLGGVDVGKLYQFSKFVQAVGLPYTALTNSSFYTSAAIFYAGGFSLGGNFHPLAIEKEMQLQQKLNFEID